MKPRWPSSLRRAGVAALSSLLVACTSQTTIPSTPPVEPPASTPTSRVPDAVLAGFEQQQLARAAAAETRGHWAAAAQAWEVLTLVRPEEPSYPASWSRARQRVAALVSERQASAEAAQRRGDLEAAAQAWLELLALDPTQPMAADALRQIERERTRRAQVGRFARGPVMRKSADADMPGAGAGEQGRSINSVREHASMLAQQGDVDGALQLLREATQQRSDSGLRGLLADLYVQKAESLRLRQPEAARAAVEAALAIDRRHAGALALQQQLPPSRPRATPAAPAAPARPAAPR